MTTGKGPANSPDAMTAMPCRESPAPGSAARERALRTLSPAECYGLLEAGGIGRVGFASADGITMLPVNFAVMRKGHYLPHRTGHAAGRVRRRGGQLRSRPSRPGAP